MTNYDPRRPQPAADAETAAPIDALLEVTGSVPVVPPPSDAPFADAPFSDPPTAAPADTVFEASAEETVVPTSLFDAEAEAAPAPIVEPQVVDPRPGPGAVPTAAPESAGDDRTRMLVIVAAVLALLGLVLLKRRRRSTAD